MENLKIKFGENKKAVLVVFSEGKDVEIFSENGIKKMVFGAGSREDMTRRKYILLARRVISVVRQNKIKDISFDFSDLVFERLKMSDSEMAETLAVNFKMANFEFVKFKKKPDDGWSFIENIYILGDVSKEAKKGFSDGLIVGAEINGSRSLSNTPGGDMTPSILATEAKKAVKGLPVSVKVLSEQNMKKLKMGGVLGVAKGSDEKPKFIIMEYKAGGKEKPVVFIGKGVTFDTGGLNLKPDGAILEMNMDMSGGAAVIHAIALAAKLKIKKNIVVLVPAVENMPSGSSYRPGDVLVSMSGRTIEVLNTDAEGRIILADALTYAKKYDPEFVVDVATLTGAALVALGQRASAIFTKDEEFSKKLLALGEKSGDYVWPLPLWDEYDEEIKGTFGDVANLGKYKSFGGAITAAVFLKQFAEGYKWAHIDIAPRMTAIDGDFLAKGSVGAPIRLLLALLRG